MQSGLELHNPKHYYNSLKEERKRDFDYCCAYCGVKPTHLTIDHIVPRSQGGSNESNNLLPSCIKCNQSKGSKALETWYTTKNHRYTMQRWLKITRVLAD